MNISSVYGADNIPMLVNVLFIFMLQETVVQMYIASDSFTNKFAAFKVMLATGTNCHNFDGTSPLVKSTIPGETFEVDPS